MYRPGSDEYSVGVVDFLKQRAVGPPYVSLRVQYRDYVHRTGDAEGDADAEGGGTGAGENENNGLTTSMMIDVWVQNIDDLPVAFSRTYTASLYTGLHYAVQLQAEDKDDESAVLSFLITQPPPPQCGLLYQAAEGWEQPLAPGGEPTALTAGTERGAYFDESSLASPSASYAERVLSGEGYVVFFPVPDTSALESSVLECSFQFVATDG